MDSTSKVGRRTAKLLSLIILAALVTLCATPTSRQSLARQKKYTDLSAQIFPIHNAQPDFEWPSPGKERQIRSRLHQLIRDEIDLTLAAGSVPKDVLRASIVALQGAATLSGWQKESGDLPFVSFSIKGVPSVAVGYSVVYGGLAIPQADAYLEIYQQISGKWSFKIGAPIDSNFAGSSFFISQITAGRPEEQWFLAWRKTFGDTGSRLRLRLFAFNGTDWRPLWRRDELTAGEVSVSKSYIQLSFAKEYHSALRVIERYKISLTGMRLNTRRIVSD